jgi:cell division septation protein DedD
MHAENDREFELVLGNKQLLGLLFITFVLLGVFFALGYAMGRNSAPGPVVSLPAAGSDTSAAVVSKPRAAEGTAAPQPSATTAPAEEQPAATPEPAASAPSPAPAGEASPVATMADPRPGDTYLQVTAVKRPEAEMLVEVLIRKGFKAALAPAPVEDRFRVLVGPVRTEAEQGKLKTDLENAGFKPIPRRY